MNTYKIKIDGKYFVGVDDGTIGKAPVGGMYDEGKNIGGVMLTENPLQARKIEGNINLKSYFNKIYEAIRYGDFEFNKLEIVRVKND